jgi:CheY-like chemotaxis protein
MTAIFARSTGAASANRDDATASGSRPSGGTILLIEDADTVRTLVTLVLTRGGYRVLSASASSDALALFDGHRDGIDLVITDVVMPGMTGPELVGRLRASRPALPVLFISGYTDVPIPVRAGDPNTAFLGKPFQPPALVTKVRDLLGARQ